MRTEVEYEECSNCGGEGFTPYISPRGKARSIPCDVCNTGGVGVLHRLADKTRSMPIVSRRPGTGEPLTHNLSE